MAWRCAECTRYWGRRWKLCPLCREIFEKKLCLLKLAPGGLPLIVCNMIGLFLGTNLKPAPLPRCSLCGYGTALNCRCSCCRHVNARIAERLAKKGGRGRAVAARWVHLLALSVGAARSGSHNALDGLLLSRGCSLGNPHAFLANVLQFWAFRGGGQIPSYKAFVWIMALVLQYTADRAGLILMIGRSVVAKKYLSGFIPEPVDRVSLR